MFLKQSNKIGFIPSTSFSSLIKSGFVLLALLAFTPFSFASNQKENILLKNDQSVISSDDIGDFSDIPFHPNVPSPTPENPSDSDDKEEQDGFDDDLKVPNKSVILNSSLKDKALLDLLQQSFQNRNFISLIILYQSWKSFLI